MFYCYLYAQVSLPSCSLFLSCCSPQLKPYPPPTHPATAQQSLLTHHIPAVCATVLPYPPTQQQRSSPFLPTTFQQCAQQSFLTHHISAVCATVPPYPPHFSSVRNSPSLPTTFQQCAQQSFLIHHISAVCATVPPYPPHFSSVRNSPSLPTTLQQCATCITHCIHRLGQNCIYTHRI